MIQTSEILSYLTNEDFIEVKKLEKALKLTKKIERSKLDIAIKALNKLEIIQANSEGKIRLNNQTSFIKAKIRCSSKGYCFAIRDGGEEDIYIREQHLNHAWHDDQVLIKLHREAQRRRSPEGIVLCILERNTTNLISFLKQTDGKILAEPLDDRINSEIELTIKDKKFINTANIDNPVEVKINKYPIAQYKAEGEVIRNLPLDKGESGDIDILLTKSNLQFEHKPPKISIKDISKSERRDLTNQPSLLLKSWKSDNSPSLPAIHVEQLESGTRIWIHTPAVSERLNIGGKIDNWLKERGTSICLGNNWRQLLNKDMKELTEFNIDKVNEAVSISYDIDQLGRVIHWEFYLSRIKPVAQIDKKQMELIANRKPKARTIPLILKPIKDHISSLQTLIFCCKRLNDLDQSDIDLSIDYSIPNISNLSEMNFEYPSNDVYGWNLPLDISDPNSLIRTVTLTANKIWYIHSREYKIPTFSLKNRQLDNSTINEIIKSALSFDVKIDLDENGSVNPQQLADSINSESGKRIFNKILKQSTKNKLLYISKDINSQETFNLSKDFISSISSKSPWCFPNLNYLDILNQHLIVLLLRDGKYKPKSRTTQYSNIAESDSWNDLEWDIFSITTLNQIDNISNQSNLNLLKKHISNSISFKENLIAMSKSREALKITGQILEAYITGVQSYGFFAEIPPLMIEGLVHVSTLNDDWYEYRSRQSLLVGRKNKRSYKLGNKVFVKIIKVDLLRNQIDLELMRKPLENDNSSVEEKNDTSEVVIT